MSTSMIVKEHLIPLKRRSAGFRSTPQLLSYAHLDLLEFNYVARLVLFVSGTRKALRLYWKSTHGLPGAGTPPCAQTEQRAGVADAKRKEEEEEEEEESTQYGKLNKASPDHRCNCLLQYFIL